MHTHYFYRESSSERCNTIVDRTEVNPSLEAPSMCHNPTWEIVPPAAKLEVVPRKQAQPNTQYEEAVIR
jgi:hypothetical protein